MGVDDEEILQIQSECGHDRLDHENRGDLPDFLPPFGLFLGPVERGFLKDLLAVLVEVLQQRRVRVERD